MSTAENGKSYSSIGIAAVMFCSDTSTIEQCCVVTCIVVLVYNSDVCEGDSDWER